MRVGLALPVGEDPDRGGAALSYRELRELALLAEDAGLDSIWLADHLFYQPSDGGQPLGLWEAWTILTALAEATGRVELGQLVLCVPFRNAGLTAWMANTLDEVSGGRFVLGLGCGWHEPEFRAFGFDFDHRVGVFADSLEVTVPLLREGRADHDGRLAVGHAELRPRGPRPAGPPILIASRKPRMNRLAARWADRWNTAWFGPPAEPFIERRAALVAACDQVGRDPAEIEITVGLIVSHESALAADADRSRTLLGEPEQIAEGLAAWRDEGVAEVMFVVEPPTPAMVERLARAAELLRRV
jgi:alkanesulfonate monooxygenase SsuD/methylene tetrahydromethanopterin reductase-like flavin-dependent oxidoreductase (luciferase family)